MNVTRPTGATHADPNSKIVPWYRLSKEGWSFWSDFRTEWKNTRNPESWHEKNLIKIVDTPQQDLTTLDVPFGELDRDTQLRLVNHVLDGDDVEYVKGDKRCSIKECQGDILCFYPNEVYRAVAKQPEQPTERETLEAKLHEQWVELNATMKRITEIK